MKDGGRIRLIVKMEAMPMGNHGAGFNVHDPVYFSSWLLTSTTGSKTSHIRE